MINKHAKGNRVEKLARDLLIKNGYLCERKNWNKWASKDFWGFYDIICIRGDQVRLIQVKSNKSDWYKSKKKILKWCKDNDITIPCESWLYLGRGKWRFWSNKIVLDI